MSRQDEPRRIPARATITLPGVGVGQVVLVDPSEPYIAECLEGEWLVPVGPFPDPESTDAAE